MGIFRRVWRALTGLLERLGSRFWIAVAMAAFALNLLYYVALTLWPFLPGEIQANQLALLFRQILSAHGVQFAVAMSFLIALQCLASYWITGLGGAYRRLMIWPFLGLLVMLVLTVVAYNAYFLGVGRDLALAAALSAKVLTIIVTGFPTLAKFWLLDRSGEKALTIAGIWELVALSFFTSKFIFDLLYMILGNLGQSDGVFGGFLTLRTGFVFNVSVILGFVAITLWYFAFDRMWRVRFNRPLATLQLASASVVLLSGVLIDLGLYIAAATEVSALERQAAMVGGVYERAGLIVTTFQIFSGALFVVVFIEAMVRRFRYGPDTQFPETQAITARRWAAAILIGMICLNLASMLVVMPYRLG